MTVLTVVTFKWKAPPGYRSTFTGKQVDTLRRMVKRNFPHPHRFVCITDDASSITEPDVEIFELWPDLGNIANPSGRKNPSCYRRLRVFAKNAGEWLGERFVVLDLDVVITGDLSPLWLRSDPFIIWKSQTAGNFYNGSMFMLDAGARPRVWEDFDPVISPRLTKQAHLYGSDQAWIAYALGGRESTWGPEDGVYSMRNNVAPGGGKLPENARIVFFHGRGDPWEPAQQKLPWVAKNYR
jgi:hypothetical protein